VKRLLLVTASAALTIAGLAGCSKTNTTTATNETPATVAPSRSEAPTTTKKGGSDSPDTTAKQATSTTKGGSSTPTMPGMPDITDLPGVPKNFQKCLDASTAYIALFAPFISGNYNEEALKDAVATLERIKGDVPQNVSDALQTLQDGIKNIKSQSDMINFFASDEYTKANETVTNYLTVECQKVG